MPLSRGRCMERSVAQSVCDGERAQGGVRSIFAAGVEGFNALPDGSDSPAMAAGTVEPGQLLHRPAALACCTGLLCLPTALACCACLLRSLTVDARPK